MTPGEYNTPRGGVTRTECDALERDVALQGRDLAVVKSDVARHDRTLERLTPTGQHQQSPLPGWLPWAIIVGLGLAYVLATLASVGRLP